MSADETPIPPPILRHLARIDALVSAYNNPNKGPIHLSREDLVKPATWEVNLGQRAGTSKPNVLKVKMVAALEEIAPDSTYSRGLDALDLAALASRLKALSDAIKGGHFWPKDDFFEES